MGSKKISLYAFPGIAIVDPPPEMCVRRVCSYYGISEKLMRGKSREQPIMECRQIIQFILKSARKTSYAKVGLITGGKDHATVMHSCKVVVKFCETEPEYRSKVLHLVRLCGIRPKSDRYKRIIKKIPLKHKKS